MHLGNLAWFCDMPGFFRILFLTAEVRSCRDNVYDVIFCCTLSVNALITFVLRYCLFNSTVTMLNTSVN